MSKEVKFKKGDRVIGIGEWFGKNIDGLYGTVLGKLQKDEYPIEFDEDINGHRCSTGGYEDICKHGHGFWVHPKSLKLANQDWKVVIIPEGDKTIGRLYENNKVVKSVETTKHPDDTYSIEEACNVIQERLFEPIEPPKPTYYNGKVVCVKGFGCLTTRGKIYQFVEGRIKFDNGEMSKGSPCSDFDEVCRYFDSKFIEVVE